MAPYDVNLVCWRVVHDQEFYDAILKNPAEAIRDCGLSEAERVALLGGDVKTLYELGADAFLMAHLASWGVCGLNPGSYSESIRRARPRDN